MMTSLNICSTVLYDLWHLCFHLSLFTSIWPSASVWFASIQAKPLKGHIISSSLQHQPFSTHVLASAHSTGSYHCGDKVPLRDNRSATHRKLYLRHGSVLFNASSLLDLYAHNLERLSRSSSALRKVPHISQALLYVILMATLIPVMEEHTKLIDCLSEPSPQLIHCIAHLSEEEMLAEKNTSCFICIWVHGFTLWNHNFCQDPVINNTSEHPSWK